MISPDKRPDYPASTSDLVVLTRVASNRFFPARYRQETVNLLWVVAKSGNFNVVAQINEDNSFGILFEHDGTAREVWLPRRIK